jgi:hypothetical protein
MHAHQLGVGHEPSHPFATDPGADPTELAVNARGSIGGSRARVDVPDRVGQIGVFDAAI